jgi:Rad3-related DNA helicase
MGRVIRSKNDVGELVIMDSRILKKGYGKDFIREFPKKDFDIVSSSELMPNQFE